MSRFWGVFAICLVIAGGASAQVTSVKTSASAQVEDEPDGLYMSGSVGNSAAQYSYPNGENPAYQAIENYQVSANVTPSDISFATNATAQGFQSQTSASTTIGVTYTNSTAKSVNVTLASTILPGGFGFYMDSPKDNPTLSGNSIGDVNQTPASSTATFTTADEFANAAPGGSVGYADLSFQIFNNGTLIDSYTASVALFLTVDSMTEQENYTVVETGSPALTGFSLITPTDSDQAVGYQWDTTNISAALGALAPGQSSVLSYVTTVDTYSFMHGDTDCGSEVLCSQLLAYSGFGDPIRTGPGSGSDVNFPSFQLSLPTFDATTGVIGGPALQAVTPPLPLPGVPPAPFLPIPPSILGGVPEPETWTLMLLGTALAGAALRRHAPRLAPRRSPV